MQLTFQLQEIRILFIYHWSICYFGNLSFFLSSGTELDSKMVEPDSGDEDNKRKNHYSAVEDIINSTHKEVKTDSGTDCRQHTTVSTNGVFQVFLYTDKHRIEQVKSSQTFPSIY